jgi:hypothetical protein
MTSKAEVDKLRIELSVKCKNGLDFICSASIIWLAISYIWTLDFSSYNKSIFTFMIGAFMLPMAFLLSKVFKTSWVIKSNPLDSLGLWFNFSQLFYFPFLFFVLFKMPDHFTMVYVIITGGHFFPYSWYYKNNLYAFAAGVSTIGALLLGLRLTANNMFLIPLFFSLVLVILAISLYFDYKRKERVATE